jgi:glycosyltransferase involved in cell wall biosynthesis
MSGAAGGCGPGSGVVRSGPLRSSMQSTRVTFVIPCFNHGRFIAEAVASCLAQEEADVRVVVVNDGSTDAESAAACDACVGARVEVIHQANSGPAGARNAGAARATGEFIAFLDADDVLDPRFACELAAALRAEDAGGGMQASHAYCQERIVGLLDGLWAVPAWDPELLLITNLHPVTALVRREAFERVGGFDAGIGGYEDWELWIRLSLAGYRAVRVQKPLFTWRRHSEDSRVMTDVRRHDALYAAIMDRHRGAYGERAGELLRRSNELLRKFDCNWLDTSGYPYSLLYLWARRDELAAMRPRVEELRGELELAARRHGELELVIAEEKRQRAALAEWYEQLLGVRIHRRVKRAVGALPRPIGGAISRVLAGVKGLLGEGRSVRRTEGAHEHPERR